MNFELFFNDTIVKDTSLDFDPKGKVVHFVDTYLFLKLLETNNLKFKSFDQVHIDSYYLFRFLRRSIPDVGYSTGPNYLHKFPKNSSNQMFLGGDPKNVEIFNILYFCKYFHFELPFRKHAFQFEISEIVDFIEQNNIRQCWIAIGSPKQNELACLLREVLHSKNMDCDFYAVGGALNLLTTNRIPKIFRQTKTIWLYRLITQKNHQLPKLKFIIVQLVTIIISKILFRNHRKHLS